MQINTNERELSGEICKWFQLEMDRNSYPFAAATNEAGLKNVGSTKFGDIFLWKDRANKQAFTLLELKPPHGNAENLKTLEEKLITLQVKFAFTWDFQTLSAYELQKGKITLAGSEPTPVLNTIDEWLRGDKQATLKSYVNRFCVEFVKLHDSGKFVSFAPDKIYFIHLIRGVTNELFPVFEAFISNALAHKAKKAKIDEYIVKQGITMSNENDFLRLIATQRVYGLATKIIFYLTIKRYFSDLPDLVQENTPLTTSIRNAFAKAREKDWQAVFEEGPIDELGIPENSFDIFIHFFKELEVYHFNLLPEDIIGELFQEIIDPDQRHTLGQYFTSENLVDFVIALVVNNADGIYCDPTCGSGTFLIRLYDRLKYLNPAKTHKQLLNQIWGFDLGNFPAELSTINLFRQDPSNFTNFPRVRAINIFDVHEGMTFDFPPPGAGNNYHKVEETLPPFHAFVGNFPFIRQELIEKKDKGFKAELTKLLAYEYLASYPQLFHLKNGLKNGSVSKDNDIAFFRNKENINKWVDIGHLELKLSGQADIYAYIYIHLATLLAKNGQFAIITSNSWLDVGYGSVLKQFFLDHFCVKTIVASWAEPWFDDAAVNCVITVLELEPEADKRNANTVNFVKLKQNFSTLVPHGHEIYESNARWKALDYIERLISYSKSQDLKSREITIVNDNIRTFENQQLRNRMIRQDFLQAEVVEKQEASKWGKYMRAPDVYFQLLDACGDKLKPLKTFADVKRGYTTGLNDFFYLEPLEKEDATKRTLLVRNGRGHLCEIEKIFLKKVIKSPKESIKIVLDESFESNLLIFICNETKDELMAANCFGAYNYILFGEAQFTKEGVKYQNVSSVAGRKNWWSLKDTLDIPDLIIPCGIGDTYKVFENQSKILNDKRLYEAVLSEKNIGLVVNSSLYAFGIEANSRVNLGDGLLDLTVYEVQEALLPDVTLFDKKQIADIDKKYKKLKERALKTVFKEAKQKDRQELDTAVLEALGLDAKQYLPKIYEGLIEMVTERLELPKLRKKKREQKVVFAYEQIKAAVIKDCLPFGFRQFPTGFYQDISTIQFKTLATSGAELSLKEQFMGNYIMSDAKNNIVMELQSALEAEFVALFSRLNKQEYTIPIPADEKVLMEALQNFKKYREEKLEQIRVKANQLFHNWTLAEMMAKDIVKL